MKKIYLLILVLAMVFVACKKDREVEFSTFTVEKEEITPSYTSAELSCEVNCIATIRELYLQYDTVADFSTYEEVLFEMNEKKEVYYATIGDLLDNTTYYVRYLAVNSFSSVMSEETSKFRTLKEPNRYTIAVSSNDSSYGVVSGGGTYVEGSQVTLTATANLGYRFKEWNDGNADNPRVITVTKDAIYIAHFEAEVKQYTISVYSNDNLRGTVSGGGTHDEGTQVTLTATANSGYVFKEWNDGNAENPRVITVTKDESYTAIFEKFKPEYVDLGLPSGLKWATCNVGATKPEEYGDYFAWGEVEPKTT